MRKVILSGLIAGAWIVALCHAAHGQSCYNGSSYSARSYSYTPSYSYSAPYSYAPAYVAPKKEYKNDAYFVQLVAFFPVLTVPNLYGTSVYAPPPVATAQTPAPAAAPANAAAPAGDMAKVLGALKTMNDAVKLIDSRLNRLEGNGNGGGAFAPKQGAPPPQPKQAPQEKQQTAAQIVQAKCAQCHAPSVAADVGGGFVMLTEDGKLEKLSAKSANKVVGKSHQGTMPPPEKDRPKGYTAKLPEPLTDLEVAVLVAHYTGQASEDRGRNEVSEERPPPRVLVRARK